MGKLLEGGKMKRIFFFGLLIVTLLSSCSKTKQSTSPVEDKYISEGLPEISNQIDLPIINVSIDEPRTAKDKTTGKDILLKNAFINVTGSIKASEVQSYIDTNNYSFGDCTSLKLSLNNNYSIDEQLFTFIVDEQSDFLSKITHVSIRGFRVELNGYTFNSVKDLGVSYFDNKDFLTDELPSSFQNVESIYVSDRLINSKLDTLSFLYKFPNLKNYDIETAQNNTAILNEVISELADKIATGQFRVFGLVNIHTKERYPLEFFDSDKVYDLNYFPEWYTGIDISGIPAWVNTTSADIYDKPERDSNIIAHLTKNDFCVLKIRYEDDISYTAQEGKCILYEFPYSSAQEYDDAYKPVVLHEHYDDEEHEKIEWYKIGFSRNKTGYIQGKNLKLSFTE